MLKIASTQDQKKSAMMEEMKVAVSKERETISKVQANLSKDQNELDGYKEIKQSEALALKKQIEELQFSVKESQTKHSNVQERYDTLDITSKK